MPPDERQVTPSRQGWRRFVAAAALVTVSVSVIAALAVFRDGLDDRVRGALERRLSRTLGGPVTIQRLSLDLLRLEARAEGVKARGSLRSASAEMEVRRLSARIPWTGVISLAAGQIRLSDVTIEQPTLTLRGQTTRDGGAAVAEDGRGLTRPFDVRVDRLDVRGGQFHFGAEGRRFEAHVDDLEISGSWAPYRHALVGRVRVGGALRHPSFAGSFPVEAESVFRLGSGRVDLSRIQLKVPGVDADLTGHATWKGHRSFHAEGTVRADLVGLRRSLAARFAPMGGLLEGRILVDAGEEPFRVRGSVVALDAFLGPLKLRRGDAALEIDASLLKLRRLVADAYGGTLEGEVDVTLRGPTRFRTSMRGRDLDVSAALGMASLHLPFASRATLDLELGGEAARISTWEGVGRVEGVPDPGPGPGIPAGIRGEFRFEDGRLEIPPAPIESAGASLDLALDLDLGKPAPSGSLALDGSTVDAAATLRATRRVLESLELSIPTVLEEPLEGEGAVRARVAIGRPAQFEVAIDLAEGVWADQPFDTAALELAVDGNRLEIRRLRLRRGEQSLSGSAVMGLAPLSVNRLDADVAGVSSRALLRRVGSPLDVDGRLSAVLSLQRGEGGLTGEGRALLEDAAVLGERIARAESAIEVRNGIFVFPDARAEGPALSARARVGLDVAARQAEIELGPSTLSLPSLELLKSRGVECGGDVLVSGPMRIGALGVDGELTVIARSLRIGPVALGDLRGTARPTRSALELSFQGSGAADGRLDGTVAWSAEVPVDLRLDLRGFETSFRASEQSPPIIVKTAGRFRLEGPLAKPERLHGEGSVDIGEIRSASVASALESGAPLRLRGGKLSFGPYRFVGNGSDVAGHVLYGLGDGSLAASLRGEIDLALVTAFIERVRGSGPVAVDVAVSGNTSALRLNGSLELAEGRIRVEGLPKPLERLRARVLLLGERAAVDELAGSLGGGEIRGTGSVALSGPGGVRYELALTGSNIAVEFPEGFKGNYEGGLRVAGTRKATTISGDLLLTRGLYDKDFELLTGFLGLGGRATPRAAAVVPEGVRLDVRLRSPGGVGVRNNLARLESSLDLQIGGELARPEITGRISLVEGGKIRFRSVEYRLQSGTLNFVGGDRINPLLDLRAETRVRDYDIFLKAEGPLDRFEYQLSSSPSLAPEEIVALLLTGRTPQAWSGGGGTGGTGARTTGDLAASYFAGALTEVLGRPLERTLGLEQLEITPILAGDQADPTTRVTLGKQVTDKLRVIYSADLGATERQVYQGEYQVSRKVKLSAERDALGGIGGSIQYSNRFRGGRRARFTPLPDPGEPPAERISSVRFDGPSDDDVRKVLAAAGFEAGGLFLRSAALEAAAAIRKLYVDSGRVEARVSVEVLRSATDPPGLDVLFHFEGGPQVELQIVTASRRERRRLRKVLLDLWGESVYSEDLYPDSAEAILQDLRARGYDTATVDTEIDVPKDAPKIVRFRVDRGSKVKVGSVAFQGVVQIPEKRIRPFLRTRPTKASRQHLVAADLAADASAIRALYQEDGYLQATVDPRVRLSVRGDSADVLFVVNEGPRFVFGKVEVPEELPVRARMLLEWCGVRPGEPYAPRRRATAESLLRTRLDEEGYPKATVSSTVSFDGERADIRFAVVPGDRRTIEAVEVVGNDRTRDRVVLSRMALRNGDVLSRSGLLESQRTLYQSGLFQDVRIEASPADASNPGAVALRVGVEEAPHVSLSLGAGYNTETGPHGSFAIGDNNLGGTGRSLSFNTRLGESQRYALLAFTEPRLGGPRQRGVLGLYWERLEETGYTVERKSLGARVEMKIAPRWTQYVRYAFQQVDLPYVEDEVAVYEQKLSNLRLGDLSWALVRDTRDDPFDPSRGLYLSFDQRVYAPVLASDASFVKLFFQTSGVLSLPRGMALAGSVRVGAAGGFGSTDRVPLSERFFAGGDSTVRGFARDTVGPMSSRGQPLGGEGLFILNGEWRFPIWKRLRGVVFYDAGNVYYALRDLDPTDLRHAAGIGLRLSTPIGPLRLEYGRKLDREAGESSGELFFAIGSLF